LRHLREGPLRLSLWSLVTDVGVPIVMAAAESPRERIFTIGASCNLDAAKAVNKAVVEALHGFVWGRSKLQCGEAISSEAQIKSPQDHLSFYLDSKNRTRAEFLFAEGPSVGSSSLPEDVTDLESLVARLGVLGYSALVADLTTRDIADLGLCVTRVLAPGLQPLLFGSRNRTRDERRLRRLASHWRAPFPPEPNSAPHPFP
jgi:thiazole/oxazole-forming peptide maturase SagD family component